MLEIFQPLIADFEIYAEKHFPRIRESDPRPLNQLVDSMQYSFSNGGKRFRPVLSALTAQTLGQPTEKVWPVALAVEFIHTYSLIHDDLPCMDNDDLRRGRPTNHKVYGEAIALLSGDALLTQSFGHLAREYRDRPAVVAQTVSLLSDAAGWAGMVGGQVVDIENDAAQKTDWIQFIHTNKTGALIRVSVEAAAVACEATDQQQKALRAFAENIGFAFQLADDILDWNPERPENTSYVAVHGLEKTRERLKVYSQEAEASLKAARLPHVYFSPLIEFNLKRNQ